MSTAYSPEEIYSRHSELPGFCQDILAKVTVLLIGMGGLGFLIAMMLARKGLGRLILMDMDEVSVSNLSRQPFTFEDLGLNKAERAAIRLRDHCIVNTELLAIPLSIEKVGETGIVLPEFDIAVCGVDNNAARRIPIRIGLERSKPIIFTAVDYNAESCSVSIQEPGKACFGCIEPDVVVDSHDPCRIPAAIDINAMASGLTVYALDHLVMDTRPIAWNHRRIHAAGFMPGVSKVIEKDPDCPFCGKSQNILT